MSTDQALEEQLKEEEEQDIFYLLKIQPEARPAFKSQPNALKPNSGGGGQHVKITLLAEAVHVADKFLYSEDGDYRRIYLSTTTVTSTRYRTTASTCTLTHFCASYATTLSRCRRRRGTFQEDAEIVNMDGEGEQNISASRPVK